MAKGDYAATTLVRIEQVLLEYTNIDAGADIAGIYVVYYLILPSGDRIPGKLFTFIPAPGINASKILVTAGKAITDALAEEGLNLG